MDSKSGGFYDSFNGYQSFNGTMSPGPEELLNYANLFDYKDPSVDLSSVDFPTLQNDAFPGNPNSSSTSSGASAGEAGSPDDSDSDTVLKYINQVLMEENMGDKPSMFYDPLALQAAEKPFYDALGQNYPLSPNEHPLVDHFVDSPEDNFSGSSGDQAGSHSTTKTSAINTTDSIDSRWLSGSDDYNAPSVRTPAYSDSHPSTISPWSFSSFGTTNNPSMPVGFSIFSDRESMIQFQKGVEEASKFLPKSSNLVVNLDNIIFPEEPKEASVVVKSEKEYYLPEEPRIKKIHHLDDGDLEDGRSSKLSAVSVEEADDLSDRFDKVLLCPKPNDTDCLINQYRQSFMQGLQTQGSDQGGKGHPKKQDFSKNVVDLRTLLILGAQAAASDDRRTANELLKQIRQHSSPQGDGSQRLAHFFANALEARLAGTGSEIYTALASKRITAAKKLEAYQLFLTACPFKKISIMFSNLNILKVAEKRMKLHVIDFGILYGFQWPALIQSLSERPEGPPLLRLTGIELPQPGFRPAQRVEETGRRLAKYCERFGVPFEFRSIAQKWETIKLEDLKLEGDEVLVVNCLFRLKNFLDETIVVDSPRNAVLNLIRQIKPNIFVHGIVNGSFNAPFFITRFREALFHYSTLFDMLDTNAPRANPERSMFEGEFYGREIMNVIACEGTERVERPETYKQWQARNAKSGFRHLPLHPEVMEHLRHKMKYYHKDYSLDVNGNWTLMGWKGRVAFAISAWVPS